MLRSAGLKPCASRISLTGLDSSEPCQGVFANTPLVLLSRQMVAPGGFEAITTSPFVSIAGSAAGVTGAGVVAEIPGIAGGVRMVRNAAMRVLTDAASGAAGSWSRYF